MYLEKGKHDIEFQDFIKLVIKHFKKENPQEVFNSFFAYHRGYESFCVGYFNVIKEKTETINKGKIETDVDTYLEMGLRISGSDEIRFWIDKDLDILKTDKELIKVVLEKLK